MASSKLSSFNITGVKHLGRLRMRRDLLLPTVLSVTFVWLQLFLITAEGSEDHVESLGNFDLGQIQVQGGSKVAVVDTLVTDFLSDDRIKISLYAGGGGEMVEDYVPPEERPKCRKFLMIMAKRLMKIFNGCITEVKEKHPEKEDFSKHFQCVMKCSLHKVHMLDDNFALSNATINVFIMEHIPEEYHSLTNKIGQKCIRDFTKIITKDAVDPQCLNYGDYIKCMQTTVADQCKSETVQM